MSNSVTFFLNLFIILYGVLSEILKAGHHSIFLIERKIRNNNTRMLNTLFIDYFVDIMKQYFPCYNHNWRCNSVTQRG